MSQTAFKHLFQPIRVGSKTLKHRLNFGAHTANMAELGLPGDQHLGYYLERAKGGAAMIVVEPVPTHATGVLTRGNFLAEDDAIIRPFRRITEACQAEGAVMIHQLYHVGQHGDADNSFLPNMSPSGLPSYHDCDGSHTMTDAEVAEQIDGYVNAAKRAQAGGFDGVELFANYNALIEQFWTPFNNRRDDRWGGEFENRMRFSAEICRRIRDETGPDFVIGLAVSHDPEVEVSLSMEALQEICAWHDERGLMDYVTCGTGSYFDFYKLMPTVLYADKLGAPFSADLKKAVKHAVVQAESHIRTPENADAVIGAGAADMVSIVRGQIADPHMANKVRDGRPEDVRPCLSCNQMCWGRRYRDYWISCVVNPSAGREHEWGGDRFVAADTPKSVLVVGGGPAGLEAARVAAERGHRVTLAEAADKLGGAFRLAGMQPRRGQILDLIDWYETQMTKLQVTVRLNSPMDVDDIAAFGADAVVVATGSQPDPGAFQRALPQVDVLPGSEKPNVFPVEDVMARRARPGARVVLLDDMGHWHGLGTVWHLAEAGHQVTIVTAFPLVGWELQRTTADLPLRRTLKRLGVAMHVESAVREWTGDTAVIVDLHTAEETRIEADTLVYASTNRAEGWIDEALNEANIPHTTIGDAVAPRRVNMAIYEGRKLARTI